MGAGTGVIASKVTSFCDEVFALEPNHSRVDFIQRRFPEVKAFYGVAESIPFPENYFTKVFTLSAFHHFTDQNVSLSEFDRVLRKGVGLLLIYEPDSRKWGPRLEAKIAGVTFKKIEELESMLKEKGFVLKERRDAKRGYFLLSSREE